MGQGKFPWNRSASSACVQVARKILCAQNPKVTILWHVVTHTACMNHTGMFHRLALTIIIMLVEYVRTHYPKLITPNSIELCAGSSRQCTSAKPDFSDKCGTAWCAKYTPPACQSAGVATSDNYSLPCRVPNSESVIAVITVATSWLNLGIETGLYMQPPSLLNPKRTSLRNGA